MSGIKLPVTVDLERDGDEEILGFFDADGREISSGQIVAALNAAPKRAFAELGLESFGRLMREAKAKVGEMPDDRLERARWVERHDAEIIAGLQDFAAPKRKIDTLTANDLEKVFYDFQGGDELNLDLIAGRLRDFAVPCAEPLEIGYTNWRGEGALRRIQPVRLWIGSTDWHPEPGLLLEAIDLDKNETRHFAVKDFGPKRETASAGSGWRPRKTAPRDGAFVDLWANGHRYVSMRWQLWTEGTGISPGYWVRGGLYLPDGAVTHWMPLPEAPEERGGTENA